MINIKKLTMTFIFFFSQTYSMSFSYAQFNLTDEAYRTRLSEFFYNQNNVDILVPVKLIGNVNKPGLYHIPENTSLLTLLSISGGPGKNADVESMMVSNSVSGQKKIELSQLMKSDSQALLKSGDIIYVPDKKVTFDQETYNAVMALTGILSVLLTAVLVSDRNR